MANKIDETAIANRAKRIVDAADLSTDSAFARAVDDQLDRITRPPLAKRRETIRALGEEAINPLISRSDVFKRKDIVSKRVFYSKNKDWYQDPHFREVLEIVIGLYQRWDAERSIRETAARQDEFRETAYGWSAKLGKIGETILDAPLHEIIVEDDDGQPIVMMQPKFAVKDAATILLAANKIGRMALDMYTDKTVQEISGRDGGPVETKKAVEDMTEEERQARIDELLDKARRRKEAADDESQRSEQPTD